MRKKLGAVVLWCEQNKVFLTQVSFVMLLFAYTFGEFFWSSIHTLTGRTPAFTSTQLILAAFMLHLGMILALIIEIHGKVVSGDTWFESHQASLPAIRAVMDKALQEKSCSIQWIGVSLQSAWLALEYVLRRIEEGNAVCISIKLAATDPDFLRLLPGDNEDLAQISQTQFKHILKRCKDLEHALTDARSHITICQYSHMPNIHGPLINDEILFLSYARWTGEGRQSLSVPGEPFEQLSLRTERGKYMIDLYKAWSEKCFQQAATSGKCFRFGHARSTENLLPAHAKI